MLYKLLKNSVRNQVRNIGSDLNLTIKILSTLSLIYFCLLSFYLGLNLEKLIHPLRPDLNFVERFNSILLYLFLTWMLLIYFFQSNPYHEIIAYLHLPIKRRTVISYILILSFFNFFNFSFLLFFIPFSFNSVFPIYGIQYFILYFTGVLLILVFVSYLALFLRTLINISIGFATIPFGIVILTFLLKTVFHFSFETLSQEFFQSLLNGNLILTLCIFFALIGFLIAIFMFFENAIYRVHSEEIKTLKASNRLKSSILKNKCDLYIVLELKLITRNKRVNSFFIMAIGFLILFYYALSDNQNGFYYSFIMYILISGMFGYIFSQYLFSWESGYSDFLFSTNFDFLRYLKTKYIIYLLLSFIVFLFFLPLIIQKEIGIHLFLTALLFNSCFGYFIFFYMATFNRTRIDLNKQIFFNLHGWNSTQLVALFIIIFPPLVLLVVLKTKLSDTQSLLIINLLCLFSLLNYRRWFKIILKQLLNRKYTNLEGYRK
jgi:hypothetical protein